MRNSEKVKFAKNIINGIKKDNPRKKLIAVHVRRGDAVPSKTIYGNKTIGYYSPHKQLRHPLLKEDYYLKGMENFPSSIFLFFSDTDEDIKWCRDKFQNENRLFLHFDDLIDFTIMQLCDHNIISNSTFSWWAAWINNNPNKIVISPKADAWYGIEYSHYNVSDLIPIEWKQI